MGNSPDTARSGGAPHAGPTPFWVLACITWINSLGSGLLWSGVPFITKQRYQFGERENLLLALVESVIYVAVAISAGGLLRAVQRRGLSTRWWVGAIFVVQMVGGSLVMAGMWGLLIGACILSAVGATIWPLMESYLSSGRHGHDMRRAIGHFNVAWMSATASSLVLMAPLMKSDHAELGMLVLVPVSVASMALLRWLPANPSPHGSEEHRTHVPANYRALLHAARFILPASYVFISVVGPLLPFRLSDLGADAAWATPLASLWMFTRMGTAMLLAYVPFWHGRWGALGLGVALLSGGFATVILAPDLNAMALGLVAFGVGHGILYYAALYYAMAVGAAEVGAAGVFEALIGVGYVIGPSVGLAAAGNNSILVGTVWGVAALAMLPALWTWARTRHPRAAP